MIVLGMDTATAATAVALRMADGRIAEARDDPAAGAHPGHATRLLELARELLAGAGIGWSQVERLAVGAGPGTFTGLRVGVATARGLAQSLAVELVAVSSASALAHGALREIGGEIAGEPLIAAIDARRGEIFAAAYDLAGRELAAPRALDPERLEEMLAGLGPAGEPGPVAVGDGALRHRAVLEAAGVRVPSERSPAHLLRAGAICELAVEVLSPGPSEGVLPDYGRRPDAELALESAGTLPGSAA